MNSSSVLFDLIRVVIESLVFGFILVSLRGPMKSAWGRKDKQKLWLYFSILGLCLYFFFNLNRISNLAVQIPIGIIVAFVFGWIAQMVSLEMVKAAQKKRKNMLWYCFQLFVSASISYLTD